MLENFAVETLDAYILVNSWWRGTIASAAKKETAHRFDEKRWVCCRNKQQEPKDMYPRGTGDKNENPTHARTHTRDGGRNGYGSGGPGTLEHSARGAAENGAFRNPP